MFKRNSSILKRFFVSYLIIVLIPFTAGVMSYFTLMDTIEDYNEQRFYGSLSQTQQIINQSFGEINNIERQILSNRHVVKFLSSNIHALPTDSSGPYTGLETINFLKSYTGTNALVDNIYLYSKESNLIANSTSVFPADLFYDEFIKIDGLNFHQACEEYFLRFHYRSICPEVSVFDGQASKRKILYLSSFPLGDADKITGAIIIIINNEKLLNIFERSLAADDGYFYLFGENGELITASENAPAIQALPEGQSEQRTLNGEKYMLYKVSAENRTFAAAVPYRSVTKNLNIMRSLHILSLILAAVVSIFVAFYLSRHNFKPIGAIVSKLSGYDKKENGSANELDIISDALTQLIDTDASFKEHIKSNLGLMKANFTKSLISGELRDPQIINEQMNYMNIHMDGEEFIVMILSLVSNEDNIRHSIEKISAAKTLMKNSFDSTQKILSCDSAENEITAILEMNDADDSTVAIERLINEISQKLRETLGVSLKAAIGSVFNDLKDATYSYQNARESLEYGIQTETNDIIWFVKSSIGSNRCYYPIELEIQLINAVQKGKQDTIHEITGILEQENCENRILTSDSQEYLFYNMKGTIYKMLDRIDITTQQENEIGPFLKKLTKESSTQSMFSSFSALLDAIYSCTASSYNDLSASMFAFIERQYPNPDLGRQTFAQHFHISEEYASRFFKEHTGYNFLEYVEKTRIEASFKLLEDYKYSIEQIATAVGYNSSASFRRAFKRYTGISPTVYRQR